jgi:hypothetical protein
MPSAPLKGAPSDNPIMRFTRNQLIIGTETQIEYQEMDGLIALAMRRRIGHAQNATNTKFAKCGRS